MAERDSLNQRVRDVLLFDNYGQRLTEKQRLACEMILMRDFSLAEAAEALGVSFTTLWRARGSIWRSTKPRSASSR